MIRIGWNSSFGLKETCVLDKSKKIVSIFLRLNYELLNIFKQININFTKFLHNRRIWLKSTFCGPWCSSIHSLWSPLFVVGFFSMPEKLKKWKVIRKFENDSFPFHPQFYLKSTVLRALQITLVKTLFESKFSGLSHLNLSSFNSINPATVTYHAYYRSTMNCLYEPPWKTSFDDFKLSSDNTETRI